jgi:hypothetical protein
VAVAVDFDGVIHWYREGWRDGSIYDDPAPGAVDGLRELLAGHAVFVFTSRDPGQVAVWLAGFGFEVTVDDGCGRCAGAGARPEDRSAGRGCPACEGSGRVRFWNRRGVLLVTGRKLPAQVYVDDRGLRFDGSWEQTLADVARLTGSGPVGAHRTS